MRNAGRQTRQLVVFAAEIVTAIVLFAYSLGKVPVDVAQALTWYGRYASPLVETVIWIGAVIFHAVIILVAAFIVEAVLERWLGLRD